MNRLSPDSNLMWQSKFILPEHREAMVRHQENARKQGRPLLDEQRIEEISRAVGESYSLQREVEIELFGEFENRVVRGIVAKVDPLAKRLKIMLGTEEEWEWVPLGDILQILVNE